MNWLCELGPVWGTMAYGLLALATVCVAAVCYYWLIYKPVKWLIRDWSDGLVEDVKVTAIIIVAIIVFFGMFGFGLWLSSTCHAAEVDIVILNGVKTKVADMDSTTRAFLKAIRFERAYGAYRDSLYQAFSDSVWCDFLYRYWDNTGYVMGRGYGDLFGCGDKIVQKFKVPYSNYDSIIWRKEAK